MPPDYTKQAIEHVDDGEFAVAGDYYTQAAYQILAHNSVRTGHVRQIGGGLDRLLRAALLYRVADEVDRCRNRSKQGILIAEDLRDEVVDDEREQAMLQEYIADFHGIGGLDGADQAYQDALDRLEAAGLEYTISFHSSPIADGVITFTRYLVGNSEPEPDDDLELTYDFAGRVAYKREAIDHLVATFSP